MTKHTEILRSLNRQPLPRMALSGAGFSFATLVFEVCLIVGLSIATGLVYHTLAYGYGGPVPDYAGVGAIVALAFVMPFLLNDDYDVQSLFETRSPWRMFAVWNCAFLILAMVGFMTKSSSIASRGHLLLFYLAGAGAVFVLNGFTRLSLKRLIASGRIAKRRLLVVGSQTEVARYLEQSRLTADFRAELVDVRSAILPDCEPQKRSPAQSDPLFMSGLRSALAVARANRIEDVVIVSDWTAVDRIERTLDAFRMLPAAIHVGAPGFLSRFAGTQLTKVGTTTVVTLAAAPLGVVAAVAKRILDMTAATVAMLLLSPLLLIIAGLVKLDSPGPAIFKQRRRGYNLVEFDIWKFRTMSTQEDGDEVTQVLPGDARVTPIGRYLRRYNLDELPQLINVLKGDMSLVGPRPHAVSHDRHFEQRVLQYPRRLNVKPGITGWAQVNGFRGPTTTEAALRSRIEHDLYYIDNWSLRLDVYIILLTLLSPKAYRNAL